MSPAGIDAPGRMAHEVFGTSISTRPDRPPVVAFIDDLATETALRDGLADVLPEAIDSRRGGIRAAIAEMQKSATPMVLIVDIASESEPLAALGKLAEVVEPDVRVLVIGRTDDLNFYREVTRGMGAMEYLAKPLNRSMVTDNGALNFNPENIRAWVVRTLMEGPYHEDTYLKLTTHLERVRLRGNDR